ncbi:hypothetical protein [Streptomyces sp. NPDC055189]
MFKNVLIASLLAATAAAGLATPATAASPAPPDPDNNSIGRCTPGLTFDDSKLTCEYAGLVNS